jgi:hypothetical protein
LDAGRSPATRDNGAVTMKMIRSTRILSTNGVTLIDQFINATVLRAPERYGMARLMRVQRTLKARLR